MQIPALGVDSGLIRLGVQADGAMQVPPTGSPAGWYTGAPTPGELGPAVLVGHVDWEGRPGVFSRLKQLAPGDEVSVTRQDDSTAVFRVTRVQQVAKGVPDRRGVRGPRPRRAAPDHLWRLVRPAGPALRRQRGRLRRPGRHPDGLTGPRRGPAGRTLRRC